MGQAHLSEDGFKIRIRDSEKGDSWDKIPSLVLVSVSFPNRLLRISRTNGGF